MTNLKLWFTVMLLLSLSRVGQANPIDGAWSDWSSWSTCDLSCGKGMSFRLRSCASPAPKDGGLSCNGTSIDIKHCNNNTCQVGQWSPWAEWSQCDRSCENGIQVRARQCVYDDTCTGAKSEFQSCNTDPCQKPPTDGAWSDWSPWSACDQSCGRGVTFRLRSCTNPAPKDGGLHCDGTILDINRCSNGTCPGDDTFSTWTGWSSCDMTCGDGKKFRLRSCKDTNGDGHKTCFGDKIEFYTCNNGPCLTGHVRNVRFARKTVPAFETRSEDG